jgi:predicted DNA-binding transcriptional regulator YafY
MTQESFKRIERIDRLIRIKGTGTADQLAEKLGMSRRTVYEYLNLMKENGAPIKFCSYRQSYYYDEDGVFTIQFSFRKSEMH